MSFHHSLRRSLSLPLLKYLSDTSKWTFHALSTKTPPGLRRFHSACTIPGAPHKMVVFGGSRVATKGDIQEPLKDTHIFNIRILHGTHSSQWRTFTHGRARTPVCVPVPCAFVTGAYVLTVTCKWESPSIHTEPPSARWGHSACMMGSKMIVFGGYTNANNTPYDLNDVQVLDTGNDVVMSLLSIQ